MVLNTARLKVVEPSLCIGQETGYVKELFSYFGYSDEKPSEKSPRVIDLFSGARAISGISGAGFDIVSGLDIDQSAISTASYNLSWRFGKRCVLFVL